MTDLHTHPIPGVAVGTKTVRSGTPSKNLPVYALQDALDALTARVAALEGTPDPTPPPTLQPSGARSGWVDTKDNIQMRVAGNGNVAVQLVKRGTGPISGVRVQLRTGPVYSAGDGGTYSVAAVLNSPDGMVIASVINYKPGTNGGKADAIFPEITFTSPSIDVADGTPFWIRFLNVGTSPDANYTSMNVLMIYGTDPSPRQPGIPDSDLAVLVNTGSGWKDRGETPNIDVLPNHEGFGYTQCLTGYWKPFGGQNQVRQTFTLVAPLSVDIIRLRLRRSSGASDGTVMLTTGAGQAIVAAPIRASMVPVSAPGGDNGGQTIATSMLPDTTVLPVGTYRLLLIAPSDTVYTATPVRKPLAGSYPTLTTDWGSYTCNGFAEYSSDGGKTWTSMYGNPNQTDIQFELA